MPTITAYECPFQSQGGFRNNNSSIYREAALVAATNTQTGRGETKVEVERRLPGWTYNEYGDVFSVSMTSSTLGTGGTSFVADTIDPTAGPGDMTPISGDSDVRLMANRGASYAANLTGLIASHNAATDRWLQFQYFQTYDTQDAKGQSFYNQVLGHYLWWTYCAAKYAATGKPYRLGVLLPGHSTGGDGTTMTAMHEAVHHLAVNGRRSNNPLLAGFPVIPEFHILGCATPSVAFDDAKEADNVAPAIDRIHPSQGSCLRIARQMALNIARWASPATSQEYDGSPYVVNAWVKSGAPTTIRVRIKITAGNRLVWTPRPTEDATDWTLEGGGSAAPAGLGHILVHGARFYQPRQTYMRWRPNRLPVSSITVDNTANATGYAYLDLDIGVTPTRGTCVSIQPSQSYRYYWRQTEAIDTDDKLLAGLREEAGGTPYAVDAACSDLAIAGRTFMPVLPAQSVAVAASDPGV